MRFPLPLIALSLSIAHAQQPPAACLPTNKTSTPQPTPAEFVHRIVETTPKPDLLYFGDIAFSVFCGTPEDSAKLFSGVVGKPIHIQGGTVIAADEHTVRVAWDVGSRDLDRAFFFHFDQPFNTVPPVGSKIDITGTYASYNRQDFLLNITGTTAIPVAPTQAQVTKRPSR